MAGQPKRRKKLAEAAAAAQAAAPPKPKPVKRPLDAAAFTDLCHHLAMGDSLRAWAEKAGRAPSKVLEWVQADPEGRLKAYREARRMQADTHIDQLIDLADEDVPKSAFGTMDSAAVQDKRLRIDTRKWIASKFHPGLYGDKVEVSTPFKPEEHTPDDILKRIVGILATHGLRVVPAEPDGPV